MLGDDLEVVEQAPLDLEHELSACLVCGSGLGDSELFQRIRVLSRNAAFPLQTSRRVSRIDSLVDPGSFEESHRWITSIDPLVFFASSVVPSACFARSGADWDYPKRR